MPLIISASFWLLAFVLALMPITAYENEFFTGAMTALVFSCLTMLSLRGVQRPDPPIADPVILTFLLLWLLAFISLLTSAIPFISLIYLMFFSAWPLSFYLGSKFLQCPPTTHLVFSGLAAIFAVLGIFALVQFFTLPEWLFQGRRVNLPLADPNTLAGLLSLGLWGGIGLMLHGTNRLQRNAGLALAILLFCALLTTGSRGALMAFGISFALFVMLNMSLLRQHARCLIGLIGGVGVFIGAVLLFQGHLPLFEAVSASITHPAGMLSERPAIWSGALRIVAAHPWTGTGIGTFFLYYREVRAGDFTSAGLMVHNDPLQFAVEMGLVAPLIFYTLIGLCLWRMWGRRALISAAALLGLVLQAHVTHNFYTLPTLMLAGLVMAVGCGDFAARPSLSEMQGKLHILAGGVLMAALAAFLCAMGSEILLTRAQKDLLQGHYESYIADINFAGRLSMNQNGRVLVRAAEVPITLLQMPNKNLTPQERESNRLKALLLLERAERVNPRLPDIDYSRALITADKKEQQRFFEKSLRMDPLYLPARMKLADLLLADQREAQALAVLAAGLDWPYRTPQARDYFARTATLALEQGQSDIQEKALRRLLSLAKKN